MSPTPARQRGLGDIRWSGTLVTSLIGIAIALGAVLVELPALSSAISTPAWTDDGTDAFASVDLAHQRQAEVNARRFDGRSPFMVPSRPKTRPAPRPPVRDTRPAEPVREVPKVETGPPATYTGPKVVGVAAELVFFEGGTEILVGSESEGVTVLAILGPRKVRLGHKGGEYEVDFLAADTSKVFEQFRASNSNRVLGSPPSRPSGNRGFVPGVGDRVQATVMVDGERRVIVGDVQSISGREGSRVMRIQPSDGGRVQTIVEGRLLEISPVDSTTDESSIGTAASESGDAANESDAASESEADVDDADEETESEDSAPIPPARTEAEYRSMTRAELEAAYPPIAHALERQDLDDATRARLGVEMNLIHDLLRPPSPGGG
jgi:hypothetical protein